MQMTRLMAVLRQLVAKLSEQSSLSGIVSIGLMVGLAAPQAAIYAGAIVCIAGLLKVLMPEPAATVVIVPATENAA